MKRVLGVGLLALGTMGVAMGHGNPHWNNSNHEKNHGSHWGVNQGKLAPHEAPEINPTQAMSALALLSGGILVIRRKK